MELRHQVLQALSAMMGTTTISNKLMMKTVKTVVLAKSDDIRFLNSSPLTVSSIQSYQSFYIHDFVKNWLTICHSILLFLVFEQLDTILISQWYPQQQYNHIIQQATLSHQWYFFVIAVGIIIVAGAILLFRLPSFMQEESMVVISGKKKMLVNVPLVVGNNKTSSGLDAIVPMSPNAVLFKDNNKVYMSFIVYIALKKTYIF